MTALKSKKNQPRVDDKKKLGMPEAAAAPSNGVTKPEAGVRDAITNDGPDHGGPHHHERHHKHHDRTPVAGTRGVGGIGALAGGKLGGTEDDLQLFLHWFGVTENF